jgi:undecaprenyl-phosphate 4-deoxy-4-formamido-L-arabinose transferase
MNPTAPQIICPAELDLSVVIPVYRSSAMLPELLDRLLAVLQATGLKHEIIFVDDSSPDNSWTVLELLHRRHPDRVRAVQLMRNFGQHNALMAGFSRARGAWIVTMDDDLQHPPEEVPKLLEAARAGRHDVVYGVYETKKHAGYRNLGSTVVNAVYRLAMRVDNSFTSFRAIRREVVAAALQYDLNFTFIDGLLAWNTTRIGTVTVDHRPRREGRSGYSMRKLIVLSLNMLTNFSLLPLQFASVLGLAASAIGILAGCYYVVQKLLGNVEVLGFASLIAAVFFFGGVQLLALGIIGEYLGRIHLNINRKPQYTVRQTLEAPAGPDTGNPA